ncbi:chromatin complexes subunit BAP18-like [Pollicipes pollicipes]|uniref:chromatin complexes subunit BAP18-like n=1 Tax=Pollicipes pollicipes TaxID=41117 RepID=UPI00188497CA|nr:chromatin complexes subunit BAP18-like [Pollicipes pollicipes]XP_037089330.1 chromatin complexes subunit BAP18-like [Pollicipes pollicipes]XP_037089331.1 chromatin complexes subunit BAP18-like [Pollicipes pollicipes]XP_037089332.1 chromatin complexes subunit BAP18-like [Pollicipes pollicipes]XP_037089333.1 chromatin complexes subunit BAP18-like [Pollicipes pollicipes]XP_037089334.1 chromatin complexes subunit BAP18-like [Pollicipes pollicipes]XP_037089335.1 chromatin complexes subunit BAP1
MNSASKVGEIFVEAGEAFNRLGNMAVQLQQASPNATNSGKWREEEIEMLHEAVKRFGADPQKIGEILKTRSVSQIRNALKTKAFGGAQAHGGAAARPRPAPSAKQQASLAVKSDVTLNMLNVGGADHDAGMSQDYFDGPTEEVA